MLGKGPPQALFYQVLDKYDNAHFFHFMYSLNDQMISHEYTLKTAKQILRIIVD